MWTWRQLLWLLPIAALGPAILWASPFGPARDNEAALKLFFLGYPAWLVFTAFYLSPGIFLAKRFGLNAWWIVPWAAILLRLIVSGVTHWPPSSWWPSIVAGQMPIPSAYFLSFPVEAWHSYLYSLWPGAFIAFIAALSFLLTWQLARPNKPLKHDSANDDVRLS